MRTLGLLMAASWAIALPARISSAADVQSALPPAMTIEQVLAISSAPQLGELAAARLSAMTKVLEGVKDEASARQAAPLILRYHLEMMLISMRSTMLAKAPNDESGRLPAAVDAAIDRAGEAVRQQFERLNRLPGVAEPLRPVLAFHLHFKSEAQRRAMAAMSVLQTLRSQFELYRLQHRDQLPDFRKYGWNQLVKPTAMDGSLADAGQRFGPYLASAPVNPLNRSSRILLLRGAPKPDFTDANRDGGFVIDEITGRLWGLDAEGKIFDEPVGAQVDLR